MIEHRNPDSLSGGMYGQATIIMRRAVADALGYDQYADEIVEADEPEAE